MRKIINQLLDYNTPLDNDVRGHIADEVEALIEIIATFHDRGQKIRDLVHVGKELSSVILEYKTMPCDSLEKRMFHTVTRYLPRIKECVE